MGENEPRTHAKAGSGVGPPAFAPPDVVVPSLGSDPTGAEVVRHAIAASVSRLFEHLPAARIGDDPEAVHQARVATRRLRSDLRTFEPLLDEAWARQLRADLRSLAGALGRVRDADVLDRRLSETLTGHPEIDEQEGRVIRAVLGAERDTARGDLTRHLDHDRAAGLFERLLDATSSVPVRETANHPGRAILPRLVAKSWRRLGAAVEALDETPTDASLHRVRILAKRVRYASETVAPGVGKKARRFASAATEIQDALGDLHDAVVGARWLEQVARARPSAQTSFAAGRLAQQLQDDVSHLGAAWRDAFERMVEHDSWLTRR